MQKRDNKLSNTKNCKKITNYHLWRPQTVERHGQFGLKYWRLLRVLANSTNNEISQRTGANAV